MAITRLFKAKNNIMTSLIAGGLVALAGVPSLVGSPYALNSRVPAYNYTNAATPYSHVVPFPHYLDNKFFGRDDDVRFNRDWRGDDMRFNRNFRNDRDEEGRNDGRDGRDGRWDDNTHMSNGDN